MKDVEVVNKIKKINIQEHDLLIIYTRFQSESRLRRLQSFLRNAGVDVPILFLSPDEDIQTIDRTKATNILKKLVECEKNDILNEILK